MTQKGQVTIPIEIRRRLGLKPHDRVRFELDGDEVKLKPATSGLLAGYGAVQPKHRPEPWVQIREEVEAAIAEEVAAES
jgi:AbrB family looped-hinge helix DNA binding protein